MTVAAKRSHTVYRETTGNRKGDGETSAVTRDEKKREDGRMVETEKTRLGLERYRAKERLERWTLRTDWERGQEK